jgi:phosphoribosylformimino-5-aminoimidazole carboxamide ribotide isomerase
MKRLLVIPSIDIQNGKTVRVVQGLPDLNTDAYGNDPVETAMLWRSENAKIIHIVDFDLSQRGSRQNFPLIEEICDNVIIPVEYGGGVHSFEDADELFSLGIYRLVIGSLFFDDKKTYKKILDHFGAFRISAAIDVYDNEVVVHARKEKTGYTPVQYAKELASMGVERFIVTDIGRNGMLGEPNIELTKRIAEETGVRVTHSGGVSTADHLHALQDLVEIGVDSVIIGRALYENRFLCQKLWRKAESEFF